MLRRHPWNTIVNRYWGDSECYTARYDRMLTHRAACTSFRIIGNTPATENPAHFLSDHFGILATFQLDQDTREADASRNQRPAAGHGGNGSSDCIIS